MLIRRVSGGRDGVATSLAELRGSETAKAVGLAGAMIVNNVIALGSTVVFARLLKEIGRGYGSLAALVSYFLILRSSARRCRWRPRARASSATSASVPGWWPR